MPNVLVLQSHRTPLPHPWLADCLASVRDWAASHRFTYRFVGDALFDPLSDDLRAACAERLVVATDLARLHALQAALHEGFDAAVWCDADVLVLDPEALTLPPDGHAVGRQVWVQREEGRIRTFRQVHNAFLLVRAGDPFLPWYLHVAERMVRAHQGAMVPQLVGPKLLTALHNVVGLPVAEAVNMLPPDVGVDLAAGGGPCLDAYLARCAVPPAALNLCASLLDDEAIASLTELVDAARAGTFAWDRR